MRFLRGLIFLVVFYALLNGGLWIFYNVTNGDEHTEIEELDSWFEEAEDKLADLEHEGELAESQEEYDEIAYEYDSLVDEYNANTDYYNELVTELDEFYLIPIPGKGHK